MESLETDLSWSKPRDVQSEESTVSLLEGLSGPSQEGIKKGVYHE